MNIKLNSITKSIAATVAAIMLCGQAQAQSISSLRAEFAQNQRVIRGIFDRYPGSTIVYAGCRAVAEDNYRTSGNIGDGLAALGVCSAFGCGFTDDYKDCLAANSALFIIEIRQTQLRSRIARG